MNSPEFVRRINAGLEPALGGDRIVMGARVLAVPSRRVLRQLSAAVYVASALALVFVYLWARGHWHVGPALIGFVAAELAALALGLTRIFIQRPMLLAVTRRQLVYCRLSGSARQPTAIATAPLSRVRITVYGHGRPYTVLRCLLPGSGPIRLNAVRGCEDDLDQVVALAYSAGARVHAAADNAAGPSDSGPRQPDRQPVGQPDRQRREPASDDGGRRPREQTGAGMPGERQAPRPDHNSDYPGEHRRGERGGGTYPRS